MVEKNSINILLAKRRYICRPLLQKHKVWSVCQNIRKAWNTAGKIQFPSTGTAKNRFQYGGKNWVDIANRYLELAQSENCIDHRSHKERGVHEQSTIHEDATARIIEKRKDNWKKSGVSKRCKHNRQIKADNKLLRELKSWPPARPVVMTDVGIQFKMNRKGENHPNRLNQPQYHRKPDKIGWRWSESVLDSWHSAENIYIPLHLLHNLLYARQYSWLFFYMLPNSDGAISCMRTNRFWASMQKPYALQYYEIFICLHNAWSQTLPIRDIPPLRRKIF